MVQILFLVISMSVPKFIIFLHAVHRATIDSHWGIIIIGRRRGRIRQLMDTVGAWPLKTRMITPAQKVTIVCHKLFCEMSQE